MLAVAGYDGFGRSHEQVISGHEFCGTDVATGRNDSFRPTSGGAHTLQLEVSDPQVEIRIDDKPVDRTKIKVRQKGAKQWLIVEAIKGGFEKNAGDKLPALKDRLEKFIAKIPDLKEGETLSVVYVPSKGTRIEGLKGEAYNAEGKDFADALFSVWVGKNPVDEELKKGMLGN